MPSRPKYKRTASLPVIVKNDNRPATRPVMVLVLGPHRSGTSLTARMLECLGAENSRNLNPPNFANPKGYFEDFDIYQFNDNILLPKLQQSWASVSSPDYSRLTKADRSRLGLQALEILRRNYILSNPLSVLKDPRINNTLPFWLSLLEHMGFDVRFVCTVRDPVSVARSLLQRDNFSLAHGGMIYLTTWLSILPHLQERQVSFVQFDEIFTTPGKVLAKVADKLGLPLPADFDQRVHAFASAHLDPALRHSSLPREDVMLEPDLPPIVAELYRVLLDAAQSQNVNKTAKFVTYADRQIESLAPLLADYDTKQSRFASLQNELEAAKAECARLQSQITDFTQQSQTAVIAERDAAFAERETLHRRLSALEAEHSELVTRHQPLATVLGDLQGQNISLVAERNTLAQERDQIRSERDILAQERNQAVTQRDALIAERDTLAARASAMEAEHADLVTRHSLLVTEREALQSTGSDLTSRHQQLAAALEELQGLHSSIVAERDGLLRELSSLKGDHEKLSLKHNVFMGDFGKAAKELSFQREQMERDQTTLTATLESLRQELEKSNEARMQHQAKHVSLGHERDSLKARIRDLESELNQTAESRDSLASQRDTLQANLDQRFKELAELATSQGSISRERDSLKARLRDLESELSQTAESRDSLASQRDTLQANLDQRFKELADLAQELARKHQQLDIAARKSQLTDGSVISVADIQIREVHSTGNHKHIAFDCYNVKTASSELTKLAIRVVRHFDKEGIAVFRDHEHAPSVLRDWVTSGKENGIPYMLVVLDDAQTQQWLANACASDFQTVLFLAEICSLSLARQQTNTPGNLNCEASYAVWLPVAQTFLNKLAPLSRVLRFDSVTLKKNSEGRGYREDFELSGVSLAGAFARNLRFSVTREGLRSKLSVPNEQPGSVFWPAGDPPLELNLPARLSASGIAWTPAPAQNPGSLRASWALALADSLPRLRTFAAGEKP